MRVAVLTTQTTHHAYFVRQLAQTADVVQVVLERDALTPNFETRHKFEDLRDDYEKRTWFQSGSYDMREWASTLEVGSVNDPDALSCLRSAGPEVVIVFGTGKLSPEAIAVCPRAMVNLHGGDPEEYRGLDTHLWAIYHGDFRGLVTTLHRINDKLDDGETISQAGVPLRRDMGLHELRGSNAEVCVRLAREAVEMCSRLGRLASCPQKRRGRYYSFMPAVLKGICQARFESYTRHLS